MKVAQQKLLLEHLVSSKDLYARCAGILKPSYFDISLKQVLTLVNIYYQDYNSLPSLDVIKALCEIDLSPRQLGHNEFVYWCDQCEEFAKESAMKQAIQNSIADISAGDYGKVYDSVSEALKISLDRDLGVSLYENPRESLEAANIQLEYIPTGIAIIDEKLGGGIVRQQLTLVSANSGVGKSVIMSNVGDNMARSSLHVLYLSLELPQNMIYTRLAAISSGENIKTWRNNITKIASKMERIKELENIGSYIVKKMPNGTTANDIRSYLKQYEMQYERMPDVILLDYLDLMHPNGGIKGLGISEQDKLKSEQLYEIGVEINAALFTASQQNRSGITNAQADQTVIAGGFTKINVVDNYISLKMDDKMRLEGIMLATFLKTRSSDAVGSSVPLKFNPLNLRITDVDDIERVNQLIKRLDTSNKKETKTFTKNNQDVTISGNIEGLDSNDDSNNLINLIQGFTE